MTKLPSAARVVQSYLARKPLKLEIRFVRAGEELPGSWILREAGHAITGALGKEKVQVFKNPDGLLVDFANTSGSPEDIKRFTQHYGVLRRADAKWSRPAPGVWLPEDSFCISCTEWLERQARMRVEWERKGRADAQLAGELADQLAVDSASGHVVKAFVTPSKRGYHLELRPDDLLGALWLAFVGYSDRARKCQNPTCSLPYFLASRKDQKFCNELCSRLVANRRWWDQHGAEWRKGRKENSAKKSMGGK